MATASNLVSRCPEWLIAIILVLALGALSERRFLWRFPWRELRVDAWLLVVPLFVAGAIRRRNAVHLLILLGLSIPLYAVHDFALRWSDSVRPPYQVLIMEIFLVGGFIVSELWLQKRLRDVRPTAIAAAAVVIAMLTLLPHSWASLTKAWTWKPPGLPYVAAFLMAFRAPLAWLILPWMLRNAGRSPARLWPRRISMAAVVLVFFLFHEVAMVPLARWSTRGNGPFDRLSAGQCLWFRGRPDDSRYLVAALASVDWKAHEPDMDHPDRDWRRSYVGLLWNWKPQRATEGIAQALLANPTKQFATWAAHCVAIDKRYECLPILMRYGLCTDNEPCQRALREMDDLLAAQQIVAHQIGGGETALSPELRSYLADLLNKDAGDSPADWMKLIAAESAQQHGPVPPSVRAEAARVVDLYLRWCEVYRQHFPDGSTPPAINIEVPTTDDLEREIDQWIAEIATKGAARTRPSRP